MNRITVSIDELLATRYRINEVQLLSHHLGLSHRMGQVSSKVMGRGMEFSEVRHYQAGDDIAAIDWKVTARTTHPHTKLFQQEKEREVLFYIDLSPSMHFATQGALKSVIAAHCAAILSWKAAEQGDRVGGFIQAGHQHFQSKPHTRQHGVLPILAKLAEFSADKQFDQSKNLADDLFLCRNLTQSGSTIVLISDFHSLSEKAVYHLQMLGKKHHLVVLMINDPVEIDLPHCHSLTFSNNNESLTLNCFDSTVKALYRQHNQNKSQLLRKAVLSQGGQFRHLLTNEDIITQLNKT